MIMNNFCWTPSIHTALDDLGLTLFFIFFSRERREKVNITFAEDNTIWYRENKYFYFDRSRSVGPESENFTTVNLPMLVSLVHKAVQLQAVIFSSFFFLFFFKNCHLLLHSQNVTCICMTVLSLYQFTTCYSNVLLPQSYFWKIGMTLLLVTIVMEEMFCIL